MRSRPTTQVGWRPIQKVQKWAKPLEVEAKLQKDMESWGTNHDTSGNILGVVCVVLVATTLKLTLALTSNH